MRQSLAPFILLLIFSLTLQALQAHGVERRWPPGALPLGSRLDFHFDSPVPIRGGSGAWTILFGGGKVLAAVDAPIPICVLAFFGRARVGSWPQQFSLVIDSYSGGVENVASGPSSVGPRMLVYCRHSRSWALAGASSPTREALMATVPPGALMVR